MYVISDIQTEIWTLSESLFYIYIYIYMCVLTIYMYLHILFGSFQQNVLSHTYMFALSLSLSVALLMPHPSLTLSLIILTRTSENKICKITYKKYILLLNNPKQVE